jgi:hydroxymethylbilane synthase
VRLGTRGSALALAQTEWVAAQLDAAEVVAIEGWDGNGARSGEGGATPSEQGDKGRFVRAVEEALIAGRVDIGVHSAKDVPGSMSDELALAGVPAREQPRDAFVGEAGSLGDVAAGARIGTASLRRRSQLLALRPDLEIVPLRGNVDTRLRRLADGDYDGIVLAAAGLARLGRESEIAFLFPPDAMTPAPGQGTLALQIRAGDAEAAGQAAALTDESALVELTAERAAVAALDASCDTPLGVLARLSGERLEIRGYAGLPDGSEWVRDLIEGPAEDPVAIGRELATRMAAAGALEIFARASEQASS